MLFRLTIFKDIQNINCNLTAFINNIVIAIQWNLQVSREMYFVFEFGEFASESFTSFSLLVPLIKYNPDIATSEIAMKFLFFLDSMMMAYDILDQFQCLSSIDLHIIIALFYYYFRNYD